MLDEHFSGRHIRQLSTQNKQENPANVTQMITLLTNTHRRYHAFYDLKYALMITRNCYLVNLHTKKEGSNVAALFTIIMITLPVDAMLFQNP